MAEPPLLTGAVKLTLACASAALAVPIVGAPGAVAYVNSVLAALVPAAVVTSTLAGPAVPLGVVQVAVVALVTLTGVHAAPPTLMPVAPVR